MRGSLAIIKDPKQISAIILDMFQSLGLEEARQEFGTLHVWHSVVGEAISRETALERFSDGVLFIRVRNPSWRMELNYRKQGIIIKLNDALKECVVKEIIFR